MVHMPVRGEICGFTGGCAKLSGDREPGEPPTHHQRVGEGDLLVLPAAPHHHLCGVGAEGGECLRGWHLKDAHPGGFDGVHEVRRPLGRAIGPTYGGPLLTWRKQQLRKVLRTASV